MHASIDPLESRVLLAATASLVRDIIAGSDSSVSFNSDNGTEIALGKKFIFTATDVQHGLELWISDGTEIGTTMLKDINTGPGSSDPKDFTLGNGVVYFLAHDNAAPQQFQVWKTDGTPGGTVPITHQAVTSTTGNAEELAFANGKLFYSEIGNISGQSLWVSDGTGQGTSLKDDIDIDQLGDVSGENLFFTVHDGTAEDPAQLWLSDGTAGGTGQVTNFPKYSAFIALNEENVFAGQLYFVSTVDNGDNTTSVVLYHTIGDGSTAGQLGPLFHISGPDGFTLSGGKLFFSAQETTQLHQQIYSTDGVTVTKVTNLNTSSGSIRDLTDVNGTLYFTASIAGGVRQLFKLSAGKVTAVPPATANNGTQPGNVENVNGTLFFSALTTSSAATLFQSDGTSIAQVGGDPGADPAGLLNVGGNLFYAADDPASGTELHAVILVAPPPPPVAPTLRIHANVTTVQVGHSITFDAFLKGATSDIFNWDFGDRTNHNGSEPTITHKFTEASPKGKPFTVKLQVITLDNQTLTATLAVFVQPPAKIKMSFQIPPGNSTVVPMPYFGSIANAGKYKNLIVDIDWSDGTVTTTKVGADGTFGGIHSYFDIGAKFISVTAHDEGNKSAGHVNSTVVIAYDIAPDLTNAANKALNVLQYTIGGSRHSDIFEVKDHPASNAPTPQSLLEPLAASASQQTVDVYFNGNRIDTFQVTLTSNLLIADSYINIATGGGNDTIIIDSDVKVPVRIDGGAGNDTITGGAGHDTLIGGAGDDVINGGRSDKITQ